MTHIAGFERSQLLLLPEAIDDYVVADNPVRFIDAFVDGLDLAATGKRVTPKVMGRPGYAPGDLLKLYIYGYLNRVRSSRRLEAECHRNIEVIWLLRTLKPDFKTIADFRSDNRAAFRSVFREFVRLCRELNLFGRELLAVDGTRIKAVNNKDRNFTKNSLEKFIKAVDKRLDEYLRRLDESDVEEAATDGSRTKNLAAASPRKRGRPATRAVARAISSPRSGEDGSSKGMLLGYARVSTIDQNLALQRDALAEAGCTKIFTEQLSGAVTDRPALRDALEFARSGDTLIVWKLDRLARSMKQLIETIEKLRVKGIGFRSLTEALDTTTAQGRLVFHMFGALAEFERSLIRERTQAGLAAARRVGRTGGRPPKLTDDDIEAARAMLANPDIGVTQIAHRLGVSPATLYRYIPAARTANTSGG